VPCLWELRAAPRRSRGYLLETAAPEHYAGPRPQREHKGARITKRHAVPWNCSIDRHGIEASVRLLQQNTQQQHPDLACIPGSGPITFKSQVTFVHSSDLPADFVCPQNKPHAQQHHCRDKKYASRHADALSAQYGNKLGEPRGTLCMYVLYIHTYLCALRSAYVTD
jgi:hypothetical protein